MRDSDSQLNRRSLLKIAGLGTGLGSGIGLPTSPAQALASRNGDFQSQGEDEPNNRQTQATYIRPGVVHGTIGPCCLPIAGDDHDWFMFDAQRGESIRVEFEESAPARKELIGPSGTVLDVGDYFSRRISGTADQSGRHYFHLRDPPGGANSAYVFRLYLSEQRTPTPTPPETTHTLTVSKNGTKKGLGVFAVSTNSAVAHGDDSEAIIRGPNAIDWVGPEQGTDHLELSGQITRLLFKGEANVFLDGNRINPRQFGELRSADSYSGSNGLPNKLTVTKNGVRDGRCAFMVAVSGELAPARNSDGVFQQSSTIDHLGPQRGTDELFFSGEITDFVMKGDAAVSVNGERVNPGGLGRS